MGATAGTVAQQTAQGRERGTSPIDRVEANSLWLELLARKGKSWLPVLTASMAPLIRPGDQVLVSEAAAEQVHRGDIVVFRRGDDLIVHRVIKKWQTADGICFNEKADTASVSWLIDGSQVIGRVLMVKEKGRLLNLSSLPSQLANLALSVLFYGTSASANKLKSSGNGVIKKLGRVLLRLLPVSYSILVRACFMVWYPSGLITKRDTNQ